MLLVENIEEIPFFPETKFVSDIKTIITALTSNLIQTLDIYGTGRILLVV